MSVALERTYTQIFGKENICYLFLWFSPRIIHKDAAAVVPNISLPKMKSVPNQVAGKPKRYLQPVQTDVTGILRLLASKSPTFVL